MGLAGLADQILAFFFDRFGQPHAAHLGVRAIIENRVFFDRHLLGEIVALLAPALELLFAALAIAKKFVPRMGRALVRAISETAAHGIVRGLAIEMMDGAHDPAQLQKAWAQLDAGERAMSDVAIHAADRLLLLGGDPALGRQWLLPTWELMQQTPGALSQQQCVNLVRALERGFASVAGAPDVEWLTRIESAQMKNPGDAVLQYLAGVTCMRLQLWGKARQLLTQSLTRLQDTGLRRDAWRLLAELAQEQGDTAAATQAWRSAAQA